MDRSTVSGQTYKKNSPEEVTEAILKAPTVSALPLCDGNGIYPQNLERNGRYVWAIREARDNFIGMPHIGCPIHEVVFTGYIGLMFSTADEKIGILASRFFENQYTVEVNRAFSNKTQRPDSYCGIEFLGGSIPPEVWIYLKGKDSSPLKAEVHDLTIVLEAAKQTLAKSNDICSGNIKLHGIIHNPSFTFPNIGRLHSDTVIDRTEYGKPRELGEMSWYLDIF